MPRMLQRRGLRGGKQGGRGRQSGPTDAHCRRFLQGDWQALWYEARACAAAARHARESKRDAAAQRAAAVGFDADAAASAAKQRAWAAAVRAAMEHLMAGDLGPAMRRLVAHSGLAPGSTAEVAEALRKLHPDADTAGFSEAERESLRSFIADLVGAWETSSGGTAGGSGLGGGAGRSAVGSTPGSGNGGAVGSGGGNNTAGRDDAAGSGGDNDAAGEGTAGAGGGSAAGSRSVQPRAGAASMPEALRLEPEAVRRALLTIPKKAAGAGSGWLNETVRDLAFADGDAGEEAFGLIHLLLQDIVQGALPASVAAALGACVMTALDKGSPGDVRPIAMPECLRRAASRAVGAQYGTPWAEHLLPLQYGVQTRDGLEQVQLQVRGLLEAHPDWCVLRADCRNAFNTLSRRPILQELRAHFPELLPMVGQFYLSSGALHFRGADGERVLLHSIAGVQQGDPLGPFLFALGIHPALRAVQQRHPLVHLLAFLDDVHLVGPQLAVRAAFAELQRQFAAIGLETRADKNLVWSPAGRYNAEWYWPSSHARVASSGYDVLGVPCCATEELPARVLARCMDPAAKGRPNLAQKLAALRKLAATDAKRGPEGALKLLRTCALPTVGHLLRSLPPAATAPLAAAVDAAVRGLVAELLAPDGAAALPADSWAATILTLPIGQGGGGHGLPSQTAIAPLAHAASLLAVAPAVVARNQRAPTPASKELEGLLGAMYAAAQRALQPPPPPPGAGGGAEAPPSPLPPPPATAPLLPFQQTFVDLSTQISSQLDIARDSNPFAAEMGEGPQRGLQHEFTLAWQQQQRQLLDARIAAEGTRADVIWAQDSCGYAAGAWQLQLPQAGTPRRLQGRLWFEGMRASDWRITLRRSLRLPFPALAKLSGGRCALCGQPCDAFGDHADSCRDLVGLHSVAHNQVRNAVYVTAQEARLQPTLELSGLVAGTLERPADVHLPAHVPHGLQPPQPAQQPGDGAGDAAAAAVAPGDSGGDGGGDGDGDGAGACIDTVRVGVHCASYEAMGPQGALRAAHHRKARRPPPEGHFIVPIAFTTGGSFFEAALRPALTQWAALRLADADAAGDDRAVVSAQRCLLRWRGRLSAAAARGTALLVGRLLQAARGPDEMPLTEVVGTAANTRVQLAGAAVST
jgi:hypothetical protein